MNPTEAKQFRTDLSSRLMELGNLILAGTIISQVFEAKGRSLLLISVGIIIAVATYLTSYFVRK